MFFTKKKNHKIARRPKVAIVYYIPKTNTSKYKNWSDGFTKSIALIKEDFDFSWINIENGMPSCEELNSFDFILAKCCWDSKIDIYLRSLKKITKPVGIAISCSTFPKNKKNYHFYKVLWYETFWYGKQLPKHPCKIHAFGIDSSVYQNKQTEKKIDVLSIGTVTSYKRPEKIIELKGAKKIIIGDTTASDSEKIIKNLHKHNIEVRNFVSPVELTELINQSRLVYIPCKLNGGGERALLEARSCATHVKIEPDNPKLYELTQSPIWDEFYYAQQLRLGIEKILQLNQDSVAATNPINSNPKLKAGRYSFHNGNLSITGDEYVTIGSFCSFGKNISIITSNHDTNYMSSQGFVYRFFFKTQHPGEDINHKNKERSKGPVSIGNDVWIGDDVKILSGVHVGDGVCIGAGSIVTKNIPSYEIHAGVPNKKIKMRFKDDMIEYLTNLKWWYWSNTKIKRNKSLFEAQLNNSPLDIIKKLEQ
ncbi:acetyltransferase (isoleucine patch superfamily)-like protein [Ochrovirga pacifica]|uniref:acetyltransferase (isoleucine patch superfamily)-like protein n=1 Tax=Ochrovirga pacifica TaxID=1042376 RepID=UPI000255779C|nr:acetyltransferase (isoleucine patch superfamily)-like protein [Ochrovirga pacifica]